MDLEHLSDHDREAVLDFQSWLKRGSPYWWDGDAATACPGSIDREAVFIGSDGQLHSLPEEQRGGDQATLWGAPGVTR